MVHKAFLLVFLWIFTLLLYLHPIWGWSQIDVLCVGCVLLWKSRVSPYYKGPSSIPTYIHRHPYISCPAPIPPFITGPDGQEWPCMTTNSCTEGSTFDESVGFRHMKFKPAHSQSWTSTFVRRTFCQAPLDLNYLPSNTTPGYIRPTMLSGCGEKLWEYTYWGVFFPLQINAESTFILRNPLFLFCTTI